jgi:NAD(P)-dependent dehydrogenase (short-subunit alcohol dehydrogenase family)
MFVPWQPAEGLDALRAGIDERVARYRDEYTAYYRAHAQPDSPAQRDTNPSVVVIGGLGVFGFAKDKREARITTEFFVNAIHVMAGANALEEVRPEVRLPSTSLRPGKADPTSTFRNYVALPRSEAFRIEYWALEEAKLQRAPAEKELSRRVALVVGAGSGIGRDVALRLAARGAHVVATDLHADSAAEAAAEAAKSSSPESVSSFAADLASRDSIRAAVRAAVLQFGGIDILVNTAAVYPTPKPGTPPEDVWATALQVNVTGNHVLAEEVGVVLAAQRLTGAIVLTSSANAIVPKYGSEPYDVSKAALNHLIRELAMRFGPMGVRVNGIAPATVVAGSAMFPRDRVVASLEKYAIPFSPEDSTDTLRSKLAGFYARRTITGRPILPADCANAILWLAGDDSAKTTGHIIPVDGGLTEAFLR